MIGSELLGWAGIRRFSELEASWDVMGRKRRTDCENEKPPVRETRREGMVAWYGRDLVSLTD